MNPTRPAPPGSTPETRVTPPPGGTGEGQSVVVRLKLPAVRPVGTYVLIGITIFVYFLQVLSQYILGADLPAYFGMKINQLILAGEIWRFITPALLHSNVLNADNVPYFGNLLHIAFNMYALYILGPGLERYYGHKRFLMLYVLGAIGGNVTSFLLSTKYSLGASTAIFGLATAEAVFIYRNKFLFGRNFRPALINILTVVIINLFLGTLPGIDNWGHVGGLLAGFAFAWFAGPLLKVDGLMPNLVLVDQREDSPAWKVMLIEMVVLGLMVVPRFITQ